MATEDQILLRLVIKGMDPAEVQRLAQSTHGQLNAQIKQHLDRLAALHRESSQKQTDEKKKETAEHIKLEQKKLQVVQQVARAQEMAANRVRTAWERQMENLENFTTVATGAIAVWQRISGAAKQFAEEMIRVSQIMGSVGGGEGAFRISDMVGDITALDIASARNKAFLQELNLTEGQFTDLAMAASALGDALGTDAKQGLDSLLDAMATGRVRSLAAMGVVIDTEAAYKKYKEAIGAVSRELTDFEKRQALQIEIMEKVRQKTAQLETGTTTLASMTEKMLTKASNAWTSFLSDLGNSQAVGGALEGILGVIDMVESLGASLIGLDDYVASRRAASLKTPAAMRALQASPSAKFNRNGSNDLEVARQREFEKSFDEMMKKVGKERRQNRLNELRSERAPEYDISAFMVPGGGRAVNELDASISRMTQFRPGEAERGLMGASSQELQDEQFASVTRMARQYAGAMYDTMQDVNKRRKGAAGGGILGELLYGENGPTGMLAELGTALDEGANMMTAAGQQMAAGMAQALTAAIVEGRNFKSAMAQATREVLKGLATQAFTKAIFHTAEGFGALALGPIGGLTAAQHFKAAAMFGAVGVSAGLGARSIGTGSSAGAGSGAPVRAGGSSFGSGLGSRGAANDNQQPITFNLTVLPGGEAEAGRAVYKALDAYFRESGRVPTFAATGTGP